MNLPIRRMSEKEPETLSEWLRWIKHFSQLLEGHPTERGNMHAADMLREARASLHGSKHRLTPRATGRTAASRHGEGHVSGKGCSKTLAVAAVAFLEASAMCHAASDTLATVNTLQDLAGALKCALDLLPDRTTADRDCWVGQGCVAAQTWRILAGLPAFLRSKIDFLSTSALLEHLDAMWVSLVPHEMTR